MRIKIVDDNFFEIVFIVSYCQESYVKTLNLPNN